MGRARYAADIHPAGVLYGKILRSPHPHARINRIDATRALALPGVRAVATAADLPEVSAAIVDQEEGGTVNYGFYSRNVMAREKVLYRGHPLAALAATSPHIAAHGRRGAVPHRGGLRGTAAGAGCGRRHASRRAHSSRATGDPVQSELSGRRVWRDGPGHQHRQPVRVSRR